MVQDNTCTYQTAFTVSVDSANGITTGISAFDRYKTIKDSTLKDSRPEDFVRLEIFSRSGPEMEACDGKSAGQTEGSVDLSRLAGLQPSGIICEIMNEDGSMACMPNWCSFAKKHDLKIVTIRDLIEYRMQNESLVTEVAQSELPTDYGMFSIRVFSSAVDNKDYVAVVKGDPAGNDPCLVRVHSECLTGDILAPSEVRLW